MRRKEHGIDAVVVFVVILCSCCCVSGMVCSGPDIEFDATNPTESTVTISANDVFSLECSSTVCEVTSLVPTCTFPVGGAAELTFILLESATLEFGFTPGVPSLPSLVFVGEPGEVLLDGVADIQQFQSRGLASVVLAEGSILHFENGFTVEGQHVLIADDVEASFGGVGLNVTLSGWTMPSSAFVVESDCVLIVESGEFAVDVVAAGTAIEIGDDSTIECTESDCEGIRVSGISAVSYSGRGAVVIENALIDAPDKSVTVFGSARNPSVAPSSAAVYIAGPSLDIFCTDLTITGIVSPIMECNVASIGVWIPSGGLEGNSLNITGIGGVSGHTSIGVLIGATLMFATVSVEGEGGDINSGFAKVSGGIVLDTTADISVDASADFTGRKGENNNIPLIDTALVNYASGFACFPGAVVSAAEIRIHSTSPGLFFEFGSAVFTACDLNASGLLEITGTASLTLDPILEYNDEGTGDENYCSACGVMMSGGIISAGVVSINGQGVDSTLSSFGIVIVGTQIAAGSNNPSHLSNINGTSVSTGASGDHAGVVIKGSQITVGHSLSIFGSVYSATNIIEPGRCIVGSVSAITVDGDLTVESAVVVSFAIGFAPQIVAVEFDDLVFASGGPTSEWSFIGDSTITGPFPLKTTGMLLKESRFNGTMRVALFGYGGEGSDTAGIDLEDTTFHVESVELHGTTLDGPNVSGRSFTLRYEEPRVDPYHIEVAEGISITGIGQSEGGGCEIERAYVMSSATIHVHCESRHPNDEVLAGSALVILNSVLEASGSLEMFAESTTATGMEGHSSVLMSASTMSIHGASTLPFGDTNIGVDVFNCTLTAGGSMALSGVGGGGFVGVPAPPRADGVRLVSSEVTAGELDVDGIGGYGTSSRGIMADNSMLEAGFVTLTGAGGISNTANGSSCNGVWVSDTAVSSTFTMSIEATSVLTSPCKEGSALEVQSNSNVTALGPAILSATSMDAEDLAVLIDSSSVQFYGGLMGTAVNGAQNDAVLAIDSHLFVRGPTTIVSDGTISLMAQTTADLFLASDEWMITAESASTCAFRTSGDTVVAVHSDAGGSLFVDARTTDHSLAHAELDNVGLCLLPSSMWNVHGGTVVLMGSAGVWDHPDTSNTTIRGVVIASGVLIDVAESAVVSIEGHIENHPPLSVYPVAAVEVLSSDVIGAGEFSVNGIADGSPSAHGAILEGTSFEGYCLRVAGFASDGQAVSLVDATLSGATGGASILLSGTSGGSFDGAATELRNTAIEGFELVEVVGSADGNAPLVDGVRARQVSVSSDSVSLSANAVAPGRVPLDLEEGSGPGIAVQGVLELGYDGAYFFVDDVIAVASFRQIGPDVELTCAVQSASGDIPSRLAYLFTTHWDIGSDGSVEHSGTPTVTIQTTATDATHTCSVEFLGEEITAASVLVPAVPVALPLAIAASAGGPYRTLTSVPLLLHNASVTWTGDVVNPSITVRWDFDADGDYDDALGINPQFVSDAPGTYPVSMEAFSGDVRATDTANVVVDVGGPALILPPEGMDMVAMEEDDENPAPAPAPPIPTALPTALPTPLPTLAPAVSFALDIAVAPSGGRATFTVNSPSGEPIGTVEVDAELSLQIVAVPVDSLPLGGFKSAVLDVRALNSLGEEVPFTGEAKLCFSVSEVEKDNRCLAFLDDAAQKWRCEDECLDEEDGMLCGTAEHFTNFAILVGGGRGSSDDPCKNGDFFTGSVLWDSLTAVFVILGVACVCVAIAIVSYIPSVRSKLYGAEGTRILRQRQGSHTAHSEGDAL